MYRVCACVMSMALFCEFVPTAPARATPFATAVAAYDAGLAAGTGFNDPTVALGSPERFTGEVDFSGAFSGVVSPFNPPFGTDEIVQIGEGGFLTLEFADPVTNDLDHPFGVDLIVFGNGGLIDADFPNGTVGDPAGTFGTNEMIVEVSADGLTFQSLGIFTEGLFPTMGYLDSGPFDATPGSILTNFLKPIDPALALDDLAGLDYSELQLLYDGSGGGTPIDIAPSGLAEVRFIRFSVAGTGAIEIDAVTRVPEPASLSLLLLGGLVAFRRMRHA